jgi:hypothetical protein
MQGRENKNEKIIKFNTKYKTHIQKYIKKTKLYFKPTSEVGSV